MLITGFLNCIDVLFHVIVILHCVTVCSSSVIENVQTSFTLKGHSHYAWRAPVNCSQTHWKFTLCAHLCISAACTNNACLNLCGVFHTTLHNSSQQYAGLCQSVGQLMSVVECCVSAQTCMCIVVSGFPNPLPLGIFHLFFSWFSVYACISIAAAALR